MDRLTLTLDIREGNLKPQAVNVRASLTAGNLILIVKDKFNLVDSYELRLKGGAQALPEEAPLEQAGVTDGSTLVVARLRQATGTLDVIARGERRPFSKPFSRVFLREDRTRNEYELIWQPAILGRRDHRNPANNRLLALDLEDLEELPSVSRHHACITETGGTFYIESLQAHNPIYVDGQRIADSTKVALQPGSTIQAGRLGFDFLVNE